MVGTVRKTLVILASTTFALINLYLFKITQKTYRVTVKHFNCHAPLGGKKKTKKKSNVAIFKSNSQLHASSFQLPASLILFINLVTKGLINYLVILLNSVAI